MASDGLKAVKTDLGAEVANSEAAGPKAKDALRAYAQEGYKLVFGHGYEYNEVGVELAKDFPETVFVSSSGGKTAANAGAFRFNLEQGCYLAGMMAALQSKTGAVGSVAVLDIPSINSTLKAFEAGARAARPDVRIVKTVYFDVEGDVAKARQATGSVLAQGADFVVHQANSAAQGVFDACKEKGAFAIGTNADQNANPSGAVAGSATIIARPAFLALAKDVKEGKYKGAVTLVGMEQGAIDFVVSPAYAAKLKPGVADRIAKAKSDVVAGRLAVPKDEF